VSVKKKAAAGAKGEGRACIVVMERGAGWPVFAADLQRGVEESLVELQADEESYRQFARRVERRIQSLGQGNLSTAVLAVSRESDPLRRSELAARLARRLLPGAELFLTAHSTGDSLEEGLRESLLELAGRLSGETGIFVRVRFSQARESGVRWSVRGSSIPPAPRAPEFTPQELAESLR
jgi:hypothetical protein